MYCAQCGTAVGSNNKFCLKCGTPVSYADEHTTVEPSAPDPSTAPEVTISTFRDPSKLTQWLKYLLYASIAINLIAIFSDVLQYHLLSDFNLGVYSSGGTSCRRIGVQCQSPANYRLLANNHFHLNPNSVCYVDTPRKLQCTSTGGARHAILPWLVNRLLLYSDPLVLEAISSHERNLAG